MDDQALGKNLIELLMGGQAHITFEKTLAGLKPEHRNARPQTGIHSIYEELEHMRLAQEDILHYMFDENWLSPPWPNGYWPTNNDSLNEGTWEKTVSDFFKDLKDLKKIVGDSHLELTAKIPHGEGRTYLREILLVADHNSYHLGQIMQTRKILETSSS